LPACLPARPHKPIAQLVQETCSRIVVVGTSSLLAAQFHSRAATEKNVSGKTRSGARQFFLQSSSKDTQPQAILVEERYGLSRPRFFFVGRFSIFKRTNSLPNP
jgi:hypothetical protein